MTKEKRTYVTHKALAKLCPDELFECKRLIADGWVFDPVPEDYYVSNDDVLAAIKDRLAPHQHMDLPWVNEWATYRAVQNTGCLMEYEVKPLIDVSGWVPVSSYHYARVMDGQLFDNAQWAESLQRR